MFPIRSLCAVLTPGLLLSTSIIAAADTCSQLIPTTSTGVLIQCIVEQRKEILELKRFKHRLFEDVIRSIQFQLNMISHLMTEQLPRTFTLIQKNTTSGR